MKNKAYLGLLGIPLATLGIVGSVAFAQTTVPQPTPASVQTVQQASADTEVADQNEVKDQSDSQVESDSTDQGVDSSDTADGDTETNDGPDTGN